MEGASRVAHKSSQLSTFLFRRLSNPLLSPSPAVSSLSQHQGLFQCKSKDLKFDVSLFFLNVHCHRSVWCLLISIISLIFLLCNINLYLYTAAAAAAKSLQSCPTLCDPIDGSPPGSAVPGILQARTLEWVAISFSNAWKWKVKVKSKVYTASL